MLKILILSKEVVHTGELEVALQATGARVKTVVEYSTAQEWLENRIYDVLIICEELHEDRMRSLGGALWRQNPEALALAVRPGKDDFKQNLAFYRMYGFSPITMAEVAKAVASLSPQDKDSGRKGNFPVLVVEDLDSPRDIICIFIESLGFSQVVGVPSASEALSALEEDPGRFSCIVTDIRMPNINGKEMIEIIRSHDRLQHLPIVVLTAFGTLDMLVECLHVGASGFLVKPPKKEDMLRELSRAIRIIDHQESPRLASHQEAEYIRNLVEQRQVTE